LGRGLATHAVSCKIESADKLLEEDCYLEEDVPVREKIKTVEGLKITGFVKWVAGEGIEVEDKGDFAAQVQAAAEAVKK